MKAVAFMFLIGTACMAAVKARPRIKAEECVPLSTDSLTNFAKQNPALDISIPGISTRWNETMAYQQAMNFDSIIPAAVLYARTVMDVQAAVRFVTQNKGCLTVRASGHSWYGTSVMRGRLVVDVKGMNRIEIEPDLGRAVVGPGAALSEVEAAAANHSLYFPAGMCPTVAAGGYLHGGGQSVFSSVLGYGSDNVLSATVVLASGEVVVASAESHPDLYWALRGGGGPGGSFGIVTEYTWQGAPSTQDFTLTMARSAPDRVSALAMARQVLELSAEFLGKASVFTTFNDDGSVSTLVVCKGCGSREMTAFPLLFPKGSLGPTTTTTPNAIVSKFYSSNRLHRAYLTTFQAFIDPSAFPDDVLITLRSSAMTQPDTNKTTHSNRWSSVGILSLGGVAASTSRTSSAFVHRGKGGKVFDLIIETHHEANGNWKTWIEDLERKVTPYCLAENYQNGGRLSIQNWPEAYYGENYGRLLEIKTKYDPNNFFRFPQSIGSDSITSVQ